MAALLLAAVTLGLVSVQNIAAPQPAAAVSVVTDGIGVGTVVSGGVQLVCDTTAVGVVGAITGKNYCKKAGDAVANPKKAFEDLWNSVIGDLIKSAEDVVKWMIKQVLTFALLGPSLKLQNTGLFGKNATLAGMLVWFGWVIAAFGLMWQLGKMALTGADRNTPGKRRSAGCRTRS